MQEGDQCDLAIIVSPQRSLASRKPTRSAGCVEDKPSRDGPVAGSQQQMPGAVGTTGTFQCPDELPHADLAGVLCKTLLESRSIDMPGVTVWIVDKVVMLKVRRFPTRFVAITRQMAIPDKRLPHAQLPQNRVCSRREALADLVPSILIARDNQHAVARLCERDCGRQTCGATAQNHGVGSAWPGHRIDIGGRRATAASSRSTDSSTVRVRPVSTQTVLGNSGVFAGPGCRTTMPTLSQT